MEILIGLLVAAFGGLFYFKNKSQDAEVEAKLAETKGRDAELEITQEEVEEEIKKLDLGVDKLKADRLQKIKDEKNMTLAERAEAARKRYKK